MAEADNYKFNYREVVEALIRAADLHEGHWQLILNFGLAGANLGPSESEVVPAAIVGIESIGLQRASEQSPTNLTADAAVVNPRQSTG